MAEAGNGCVRIEAATFWLEINRNQAEVATFGLKPTKTKPRLPLLALNQSKPAEAAAFGLKLMEIKPRLSLLA